MPAPARTGRPRAYCSTRCRKRHGHLAERDRRREQRRAAMAMSHDELLVWLRSLPDPFAPQA